MQRQDLFDVSFDKKNREDIPRLPLTKMGAICSSGFPLTLISAVAFYEFVNELFGILFF